MDQEASARGAAHSGRCDLQLSPNAEEQEEAAPNETTRCVALLVGTMKAGSAP